MFKELALCKGLQCHSYFHTDLDLLAAEKGNYNATAYKNLYIGVLLTFYSQLGKTHLLAWWSGVHTHLVYSACEGDSV